MASNGDHGNYTGNYTASGEIPTTARMAGSTAATPTTQATMDFETFLDSVRRERRGFEGEFSAEEESAFSRRVYDEFEKNGGTVNAKRNLIDDLTKAKLMSPTPRMQTFSAMTGKDSGHKLLSRRSAGDTTSKKQPLVFLNQLIRLEATDPDIKDKFLTTVASPAQLLEDMERKNGYFKQLNARLVRAIAHEVGQTLRNEIESYCEMVLPLLEISAQCFCVMFGVLLTRAPFPSEKGKDTGNRQAIAGLTNQYFEQIGRMHRVEIARFWKKEGQTGFNPELITGKPYEMKDAFGFTLFLDDHADDHASDAFWGLVSYITHDSEIAAYQIPIVKAKWTLFDDEDKRNCAILPSQDGHPLKQMESESVSHWMVRESQAFVAYSEILETMEYQSVTARQRSSNARGALNPALVAFLDRRLCDHGIDWESLTFHEYSKEFKNSEMAMKLSAKAAHQRKSVITQNGSKMLPARPPQRTPGTSNVARPPSDTRSFDRRPPAPTKILTRPPQTTPATKQSTFVPEEERKCRHCGGKHYSVECSESNRPICRQFASTGKCEYNRRCKFLHDSDSDKAAPIIYNEDEETEDQEQSNFNSQFDPQEELEIEMEDMDETNHIEVQSDPEQDDDICIYHWGADDCDDCDDDYDETYVIELHEECDTGTPTLFNDSVAPSPGQLAFEARMKAKFEPKSEVASLVKAGAIILSPNHKRNAKEVPRQDWDVIPLVPERHRDMLLSDVLQSEREGAIVLTDFDSDDSISLGTEPDGEAYMDAGQHPITMFLQPLVSNVTTVIQAASPEDAASDDEDSAFIVYGYEEDDDYEDEPDEPPCAALLSLEEQIESKFETKEQVTAFVSRARAIHSVFFDQDALNTTTGMPELTMELEIPPLEDDSDFSPASSVDHSASTYSNDADSMFANYDSDIRDDCDPNYASDDSADVYDTLSNYDNPVVQSIREAKIPLAGSDDSDSVFAMFDFEEDDAMDALEHENAYLDEWRAETPSSIIGTVDENGHICNDLCDARRSLLRDSHGEMSPMITEFVTEFASTSSHRQFVRIIVSDIEDRILVLSNTPTIELSTCIGLPGGVVKDSLDHLTMITTYINEFITTDSVQDQLVSIKVNPPLSDLADTSSLFHLTFQPEDTYQHQLDDTFTLWLPASTIRSLDEDNQTSLHIAPALNAYEHWLLLKLSTVPKVETVTPGNPVQQAKQPTPVDTDFQ